MVTRQPALKFALLQAVNNIQAKILVERRGQDEWNLLNTIPSF